MTFITRRFSVETDLVLVAAGAGVADAPAARPERDGDAAGALVLADAADAVGAVGAVGAVDVPGRAPARRVRSGDATLPDGERAVRGPALREPEGAGPGAGVRPEEPEGAVTPGGPVGIPGGGSPWPVRPMAALSDPTPASSETSLRSTSRTPNQATETASTVAQHHTAMNPSVCRIS
ncbi:hypothetical protein ACLQ2R_12905 [Streptosporangium sp. DT93]|uniref:hypothetical protein n=1 Tax=Streptosporangium sp. DT93 TaxID=3393428 RepID=UPI003CF9DEA1